MKKEDSEKLMFLREKLAEVKEKFNEAQNELLRVKRLIIKQLEESK